MLASKSRAQYGSIDTSNTNIRPLVTILWQNIYEQQNVTHSLPYLIEILIATPSTPIYSKVSSNPYVECEVPREFSFYRAGLLGLHCSVLHSSIYRCVVRPYVAINISIRYGSEWVTFFCSYVFCHKMVTNGRILEFEVSIEP